jgi:uncharacterized protein YlxW (UPF0749 family)
MRRTQIAYGLWAIGTVVIVLSWFGLVNPIIGWGGFAVALVGSIISSMGLFTKAGKATGQSQEELTRQREQMLEKSRQRQEMSAQLLEMSRQNLERQAKLFEKWEEQTQRMDAILSKWEQAK